MRNAYLAAAKAAHPDSARDGGTAFAALRDAYETLRDPSLRLKELAGRVPFPSPAAPASAELFMEVAPLISEARKGMAAGTTSIGRAAAAATASKIRPQLDRVIAKLQTHKAALDARTAALDARWPDVKPDELLGLAGEYTFCKRWLESAEEAAFQLGTQTGMP